jgi:hypothetical protein
MKVPVAVPVSSVSIDGVSVGTQYQLVQYQKTSTSGFSTSRSVPVIPKPFTNLFCVWKKCVYFLCP